MDPVDKAKTRPTVDLVLSEIRKEKMLLLRVFHHGNSTVLCTRFCLLWSIRHPCWRRHQEHILGVDGVAAVGEAQAVIMFQHNRLSWAGVLAVAAENAAQHIDFVGFGVAFARAV